MDRRWIVAASTWEGATAIASRAIFSGEHGTRAFRESTTYRSSLYCEALFCFAHRRFCARLIFRRAAADILRRLRGRLSIIAAGSVDMSILMRRFPVAKSGKLLMSAAISDFSST